MKKMHQFDSEGCGGRAGALNWQRLAHTHFLCSWSIYYGMNATSGAMQFSPR